MLATALAGMTAINQWFVWRLSPDPKRPGKYLKVPAHPDGRIEFDENGKLKGPDAQKPYAWSSFEVATVQLQVHMGRLDGYVYTLGFMVTRDCGYWFLDVDSCVDGAGALTPWAAWFYQNLPGAFFEYSSSGKGVHFLGRGCPPAGHRTRPTQAWEAEHPGNDLEFYTGGRGIAFGLSGQAWGSADTHLGSQTQYIVDQIFTPAESTGVALLGDGPRADWRGPEDDDELIRRAMQSRSAGAMFSGKATFADLWTCNVQALAASYPDEGRSDGKPYGGTEVDFALASHLAFWTGCDAERMVRLMWRSGLMRDKWTEHRTYLAELTVDRACKQTRNVCQDKETVAKLDASVTLSAGVSRQEYYDLVMSCNDDADLRNEVVPQIAADRSIAMLDRDWLAAAIKKRMSDWGFPVSISDCKAMVRLQVVEDEDGGVIPEWANRHVYVMATDCFFDLITATTMSRTAFNAQYERMMPQKPNGDREDAAKWCLQRWNTATVGDTMYLPGKEPIFNHEGRWYANLYSPSTVPEIALGYTQGGIDAIQAFLRHLQALCGNRSEVYLNLLDWMAWCAQNPGKKCRYAPIIKGMPGDGKSLIINVMQAVMGFANATSVGAKLVCSDFGDWQEGSCVTAFEELMITGAKRYAVANAIKEPITNNTLKINRKGRPAGASIINVTNYIAFTNFVDAVPLEDNDRRWWVIFSPFNSLSGLAAALSLTTEGLTAHYDMIFDSLVDSRRGEWRKFLVEYTVSDNFKPNSKAPDTDEKHEMQAGGEDAHEAVARQCIETGAVGVGQFVLSSSSLTAAMRTICVQDGLDIPKTTAVNHVLARMGFSPVRQLKWDGKPHRVWWKRGTVANNDNETLRSMLELTKIQHLAGLVNN